MTRFGSRRGSVLIMALWIIAILSVMVISFAFVWLADPGEKESKWALGLCFGGAVFLSAFVLFFEYNPSYFWKWFLMKLSTTAGTYLCY